MITCPQCSYEGNSDDALFCAHCAAPLTSEAASLSEDTRGQTLAENTVLQEHYTILNKLSEGGMGAVYMAQDTKLFNKLCVIKEMLPFYTNDREKRIAERNFEREAKTLAHLRHPGIPEIYDYFIEDGRNYLVMAFVEGQNLQEILDEHPDGLPEKDVLTIGVQLSRVLAYLSERNPPTMHRDIKPANIILEKTTGQMKLVDFGIARESLGSERLDATKSIVMGTQGFAPPEQFSGRATAASDVYALGATLHYLLTGVHPLEMSTPFHFDPVRTYRPEISPRLDELILEMVCPDPVQRPSAPELKERFERLTGTQVAHQAFVMRNGVEVYSLGELVQACEKDPAGGRYHLRRGHFRDWFLTQNRHDLAEWADRCLQEAPDDMVALEWFLRFADPTLPPPEFVLDEPIIDFGEVERDSNYSLLVSFTNASRGYLLAAVGSLTPWLEVETEYVGCYAGETGQIQLTLATSQMPEGVFTKPALSIVWEDQRNTVPVQMRVIWPPGGRMEPEEVDMGYVWDDQSPISQTLTLNNTGGSEWIGRLHATVPWLQLQQDTFRIPTGSQTAISFFVHPGYMPGIGERKGLITLVSNSGSQVTSVRARKAKPWYVGRGRWRRWLAFAAPALISVIGLGMGVDALAGLLLQPRQITLSGLLPAMMALGAWLLGLMLAGVFTPALDEMENFHHGGDLSLDVPVTNFRWNTAIPVLALLMLVGLIVGHQAAALRTPASGLGQAGLSILGLLAGGVAGAGMVMGNSDVVRGMRSMPGMDWFIHRPVALGLLRTFAVALALAMLAMLAAPYLVDSDHLLVFLAAVIGLLLTSDQIPYLPKRLALWMGWLRPAIRAVFLGFLLGALFIFLFSLNPGPGGQTAIQRFLAELIILLALPLGALVGIATHDEIGFDWKDRLRESVPLAILNLLAAPIIFVFFDILFTLLAGGLSDIISYALTAALLTFISLGLAGSNTWASQVLQQVINRLSSLLRRASLQAPELNLDATQPVQWLSTRSHFATVHPFILATIILASTLTAPLWIRILGALLWFIVLASLTALGLWFWRRKAQNRTSPETLS